MHTIHAVIRADTANTHMTFNIAGMVSTEKPPFITLHVPTREVLTKLSHKNLRFPNQHSFILPQRFHVIKRTERGTAFLPVLLPTL